MESKNEKAGRQPVTDCNCLGNAAKMREALELIHELLSIGGNPDTAMCIRYEAAYQIAAEALSSPPRNCDVGTADEQEDRFERFCDVHKYVGDDGANICSQDCPCYNYLDCGVRWAQMPYEQGDAK